MYYHLTIPGKKKYHEHTSRKAIIIEQFQKVNDVNLIHAIKNMLDYALNKEQEHFDIPEAHQKLVMERFDKVRKNIERLLD